MNIPTDAYSPTTKQLRWPFILQDVFKTPMASIEDRVIVILPFKISGVSSLVQKSSLDWCCANTKNVWLQWNGAYYFGCLTDATMFKLTWTGE